MQLTHLKSCPIRWRWWGVVRASCPVSLSSVKYHRDLRDIEFDLEDDQTCCLRSATYSDESEAPLGILRVTQIFENPRFVIDGVDVVDIIQGKLSYRWLLSTLSTMSTSKGLTEKYALRWITSCITFGMLVGSRSHTSCQNVTKRSAPMDSCSSVLLPSLKLLSTNKIHANIF